MIDFSQLSNAVLERLAVELDIIVKNHIYIFTKTFDVYICWLGRITVARRNIMVMTGYHLTALQVLLKQSDDNY